MWEKRARACYEDNIKLSSNEFIHMTLVDGISIVELLLKNSDRKLREADDEIFLKEWVHKEILHDMMLLENQLPFFVIEYLFDCLKNVVTLNVTLLDLVYGFFGPPLKLERIPDILHRRKINHLVDLLLFLFMAPDGRMEHWVGGKLIDTSSATELEEAGVNFVGVTKECPHDIEFDIHRGVLKIPRLVVNQWTDSLLGNLKAYEQCHYTGTIISSYLILMDNLIKTPTDVDLLISSGIIDNLRGTSKDVCTVFNNLYKKTALDNHKFLFSDTCEQLNAYSRDYWHQWKSTCYKWKHILKHDYFSNPWTIISVIGAVTLLILTVIQTVCSILALKRPGV